MIDLLIFATTITASTYVIFTTIKSIRENQGIFSYNYSQWGKNVNKLKEEYTGNTARNMRNVSMMKDIIKNQQLPPITNFNSSAEYSDQQSLPIVMASASKKLCDNNDIDNGFVEDLHVVDDLYFSFCKKDGSVINFYFPHSHAPTPSLSSLSNENGVIRNTQAFMAVSYKNMQDAETEGSEGEILAIYEEIFYEGEPSIEFTENIMSVIGTVILDGSEEIAMMKENI